MKGVVDTMVDTTATQNRSYPGMPASPVTLTLTLATLVTPGTQLVAVMGPGTVVKLSPITGPQSDVGVGRVDD